MSRRADGESAWIIAFGQNLQSIIKSRGVSQQLLARKLGITDAMMSRYVHGLATPSIYKVKQLADILCCKLSDLIKATYD